MTLREDLKKKLARVTEVEECLDRAIECAKRLSPAPEEIYDDDSVVFHRIALKEEVAQAQVDTGRLLLSRIAR